MDVGSRSYLIECKNVEKEKPRKGGVSPTTTVDFQRTRAPIGRPDLRYYSSDEFHVLAACLWNRTQQWQFLFAATRDLPRHPKYPDRLSTKVVVGDPSGAWTDDLAALLKTL